MSIPDLQTIMLPLLDSAAERVKALEVPGDERE
jgi:hypothetical protein